MTPRNPLGITDELADDLLFGRDHGAFEDCLGRRLESLIQNGVCDDVVAGLIHGRVQGLRRRAYLGQLPPFRVRNGGDGELAVLDLEGRRGIRMRADVLSKNGLFVSRPGGGKSVFLCHLSLQLAPLPIRLWLSDGYKQDLRGLRRAFDARGKVLVVLRWRDWRFNLLQAGRRDPEAHLRLAVDLLDRVIHCPERARAILEQTVRDLYRRFGNWTGNRTAWPTLNHLYERIRSGRELNAPARDALLDRLGALIPALGRPYSRGWDPEDLAGHSIVFEMLGATESAKELFLSAHLFSVLHQVYASGAGNCPLRLVVAFDDAQRIVSHPLGGEHMPALEEYLTVNRGAGIGVWLNVQTLDGVSRRLVATCGNKIMGVLESHSDYASLGADMGMSAEQIQWAKLNLRAGIYIGRMADDTWRHPFAFTVRRPELPGPVGDREAEASLAPLLAIPTEPAREFDGWTPNHASAAASPPPASGPALSAHEAAYLRAVVAQPGQPSGTYARMAGLNGRRGAEVRQRLVDAGLVREHTLALGVRGRSSIVVEPLAPAERALAEAGGKGAV